MRSCSSVTPDLLCVTSCAKIVKCSEHSDKTVLQMQKSCANLGNRESDRSICAAARAGANNKVALTTRKMISFVWDQSRGRGKRISVAPCCCIPFRSFIRLQCTSQGQWALIHNSCNSNLAQSNAAGLGACHCVFYSIQFDLVVH